MKTGAKGYAEVQAMAKDDVIGMIRKAAESMWVEGEPVNPHAANLLVAVARFSELIEAAREVYASYKQHSRSAYCQCWDADDQHDSDRLNNVLDRIV